MSVYPLTPFLGTLLVIVGFVVGLFYVTPKGRRSARTAELIAYVAVIIAVAILFLVAGDQTPQLLKQIGDLK